MTKQKENSRGLNGKTKCTSWKGLLSQGRGLFSGYKFPPSAGLHWRFFSQRKSRLFSHLSRIMASRETDHKVYKGVSNTTAMPLQRWTLFALRTRCSSRCNIASLHQAMKHLNRFQVRFLYVAWGISLLTNIPPYQYSGMLMFSHRPHCPVSAVLFLERRYPKFGNSTIPIDIIRIKSYMDNLFGPMCVPVRVTVCFLGINFFNSERNNNWIGKSQECSAIKANTSSKPRNPSEKN